MHPIIDNNTTKVTRENSLHTVKKTELTKTFITPILEIFAIGGAYLFSYYLRGITDGIPFIQLRIPFITYEQFLPFIATGIFIWVCIFGLKGLYDIRDDVPLIEEIRLVLTYSFFWCIVYMSFIYLSTGFLFQKEIPRLIILYVYILSTIASITIRCTLYGIFQYLYKKNILSKKSILALGDRTEYESIFKNSSGSHWIFLSKKDHENIIRLIRNREIETIITLHYQEIDRIQEILELSRVYGVSFVYPKILPGMQDFTQRERLLGEMPVVEITSISISTWQRILKRTLDIMISLISMIIFAPLFIIIALGILLEDPSGPVIFRNRRIGKDGKEFDLLKFRYMYWKYSIKEAYGVNKEDDDALHYEEKLRVMKNMRQGPLYKISHDPRKMKFGAIIEKFSLDELPQFWNVLRGDMSLIGPRPHQPREVEQYKETDHQVLTIKPGITGMAQVYGRDANSWEEEVIRDRYYIENYSITLDLAIMVRTVIVIISRIFKP